MRRRTWIVLAAVAAAVLVVGLGIVNWQDRGDTGTPTLREYGAGERPAAPPIAGELLNGDRYDLSSQRGDVVVVNIWASWCGPCRAETADLEAVYQDTEDLGVSFLGLNFKDNRDKAIRFTEGRMTYPSIFDPAFEIGLGFQEPPAPLGPPATLVIDRDGAVAAAVYRVVGKVELEQLVRRVAAEEAPPSG